MGNALLPALLALLAIDPAAAARHRLLASSFQTKHLHALTYDDATNALTLDRRILTAKAGHASLALNRARTALYAAQRGGWASYALGPAPAPWELRAAGALKLNETCLGAEAKRGSTVLAASGAPPFAVYGVGKSPCGAVLATAADGGIGRAVQPLEFRPRSRIEGLAVHPSGAALFAADAGLNSVWVRPLGPRGRVLGQGKVVRVPMGNSGVGGVMVHPGGRYLYVLLRRRVQIAVFEIVGGGNAMDLVWTNTTISLIPNGGLGRVMLASFVLD
jgi:carboxy-cis,cis-muconate cyclase